MIIPTEHTSALNNSKGLFWKTVHPTTLLKCIMHGLDEHIMDIAQGEAGYAFPLSLLHVISVLNWFCTDIKICLDFVHTFLILKASIKMQ